MKIIPYVMTWDGLFTKYHKRHSTEIGIQPRVEAYIQSLVLKKTLESISFKRRQSIEDEDGYEDIEQLARRMVETTTGTTESYDQRKK